ncbi:hypothetical protein N431DRAFT_457570 [Stipitochalara longipes BDJ]|nr:hypothetical protein N431DRAFT_457570 [Stipitochalara longipes BDJ]
MAGAKAINKLHEGICAPRRYGGKKEVLGLEAEGGGTGGELGDEGEEGEGEKKVIISTRPYSLLSKGSKQRKQSKAKQFIETRTKETHPSKPPQSPATKMAPAIFSHERYELERQAGNTRMSWADWNSSKAWKNLGPVVEVEKKDCAPWSHEAYMQKKKGGHTKLSWADWQKTKAWK